MQQAHSMSEDIEKKIRASIPQATITIHIEPLEDPVSWEDAELDRK
ncbi:MAG: hypothetical protein NTV98_02390 [Candidatus Roizmanbacteria bacterium]|nr:hypothetical protein [Candidatus Roizmanbacteria bacterium]